jgi:hypothetical protein
MQATMAEKKMALIDAQLVESELRAEWLRIQIDQATAQSATTADGTINNGWVDDV